MPLAAVGEFEKTIEVFQRGRIAGEEAYSIAAPQTREGVADGFSRQTKTIGNVRAVHRQGDRRSERPTRVRPLQKR